MSYNDKKNLSYNTEKRRKIKEIKSNELNKECFDCGTCYPEYISINNGIFICKECLKIHNNFPKQISNTLKNNLSSLNSKELEFMYIGGNQKLLDFINHEYPQLQRYKINILYQTKAMQYYRKNLYYLVNGGIKPIKPSEKINAYELININEVESKKENINSIKKLNNNTYKKTKRNKSENILETFNKKLRGKNKTYKSKSKSKQKKIQNSLLDSDEDTLKRYKSFYKEMNKIFGTNIDITIDEKKNNKDIGKKIYKEQKIISDNHKGKNNFSNNENIIQNSNLYNNKNSNINISSKKINNKKKPIEHIYNNNFITLSATKNIFMFTPNKDSIIYKHRKINNDKYNNNNNQNNEKIPNLNTDKEIYSKPKIPCLITSNKKKEDNPKLYYSLQEKNFKHNNLDLSDKNELEINLDGDKYIKSNNDISEEYKHTSKNIKNENKEMSEDINPNINISKKSLLDSQDNNFIYENKNNINNSNNIGENGSNSIFSKKRISKLMKKDRQILENENKLIFKDNKIDKKGNKFILLKNEKDEKNLDKDDQNNNAELKKNKIDEIKSINENNNNEINTEDNKNKTFTEIKESDNKRRINLYLNINSNLTEKDDKKNQIIKEKKEEEASSSQNHVILKEKFNRDMHNKKNDKKEDDKKLESESKKMEEKENIENKKYNDNKNSNKQLFADKRRKRYDKHIGMKENVKDEGKEKKIEEEKYRKNKDEMNKNEKEIKKIEKDNYKMKKVEKIETIQDNNYSPFHRQKNELPKTSTKRSELRKELKNNKINNSENFFSIFEKNIDVSKTTNDSNENNGTTKFSIRNKYKMRKMKELI